MQRTLQRRQEHVETWTQTMKDREDLYRELKDGGGSDTYYGCLQIGELEELKDAQEKLLHWQNKLVEVGGTVPQAPALEPQVQARPARESDVMVSGADL